MYISGPHKIHMVDNMDKQGWIKASSLLTTLSQVGFVYEDGKCIGIASYETTSQQRHYSIIIVTMIG